MAETGVPRTLTLCFSRMPVSSSLTPQFNAVCPPKLRKIASGFSFLMILSTK